jgi:hypothetical protein
MVSLRALRSFASVSDSKSDTLLRGRIDSTLGQRERP